MFLEWFNFIYSNWNMRTKNLKSHVTDHVIFCWLATSSNGHFFQYFLWLCFWCLTRFAENGSHSQVKWNKKGLGNFDGLEQKPKESNVTLITSYPSKDSLFTFSKLTYRFSLFDSTQSTAAEMNLSRFLRMVGVAFFLRFMLHSHFFLSKHHH